MNAGRNLAASIRQRLLNLSRERGEDFQLVLTRYAVERLLYRLSRSSYHSEFLLKGAMLFALWSDMPHRPTRDLDLLSFGTSDIARIEDVFREIMLTEVEPDGLAFLADSVRGERIKEDQEYEGVRLICTARLEQARVKVQVDVGFGDAVTPAPEDVLYPLLLADLPAPHLLAYTRYTVVAEKLQAMVMLGLLNTRMKDFYDLRTLANTYEFDGETLRRAIQATFDRRATPIPLDVPVALSLTFGEDTAKQNQWNAFLRRSRLEIEEKSLADVVADLREFLMPPVLSAARGETFTHHWTPREHWV